MSQIVAANRALDRVRVFLAANGQWMELPGEAALLADDEAIGQLARARREAERLIVVEPYLTPVHVEGGRGLPAHLRRVAPQPATAAA